MSVIQRAAGALLAVVVLAAAGRDLAARQPDGAEAHALLDVPYLAQTPELCGGAAVAMVLRYWGGRDVFPQDFAGLVGPGAGGILTSALASSVRARGWQARVLPSNAENAQARIRAQIDQGRPLIALIEVGSRTYHYVVIVGSTDREVVVHDPARAPFRVLPWAEFDREWEATGRWALLVLPAGGLETESPSAAVAPDASVNMTRGGDTPCSALVDGAVQMALGGDPVDAEQVLGAATRLCPTDAAGWRELAGLRFSQSRWLEAQDLAASAVHLAPDDAYAWQILATSRYLVGDLTGALDAWNRVGEPHIDTLVIQGAARTRQPVIVLASGLKPRQLLTSAAFGRALRRLRDLPVAIHADLRYEPVSSVLSNGDEHRVTVDVSIAEHRVVPKGWAALATLGARALIYDELHADMAGVMGAGEMARASWRWTAQRPRVMLALALPSTQWLPGVVSIDALWERQTYSTTTASDGTPFVEGRRRVGLRLGDWATSWLRWHTGAGLDRLRAYDGLQGVGVAARDYLAAESSIDLRFSRDRVAVTASGGWWTPFAGGRGFGTGEVLAAWRSTTDTALPSWSAVTDVSVASPVAPLALWSGAGTGQGRSGLLRAHPLLNAHVMTGPVFGRDVVDLSIERARPIGHTRGVDVAVVGFVDAARAWRRLSGLDASPLYVDAGLGLRVRASGSANAIRIDVAHGLRGGGTAVSASWSDVWPR